MIHPSILNSVFINKSIRSVIHAILIFAVGLFCCLGSSYTIEVKHDHAHDDVNCNSHSLACNHTTQDEHSHCGSHHSHHDHGHDHDENNNEDDDHSQDPHDRSHSHSHFVSIDLPAACLAKVSSTQFAHIARYSFSHVSDTVPDGPFYDLIKPPQLG